MRLTLLQISALICTSILIFVVSCARSSGSAGTDTDSACDLDSVSEEIGTIFTELPDTAYPSAEVVKFEVTEIMKETSGRLDELSDLYSGTGSVLTFRGGPFRDARFGGKIEGRPTEIKVDWTFTTDSDMRDSGHGRWDGGTGWTGQPLYVVWPADDAAKLRNSGMVKPAFNGEEIIFGSLCSNVYFLDPATGSETREPIPVGNPVKGTVSMDPSFNGNLYVGHGVAPERPFGALLIDLYKDKVVDVFGEDPKAWRGWGAYDSSALRVGQFVFRPAENGSLYKFISKPGKLSLHSVLRYRVGGVAPGIESSMSVYANYGFVADNHGNVIAVNLNTLKPVWCYRLGDDTDASPVIAVEEGVPYIYIGCEIDLQSEGEARFVKLNAYDGTEVWRTVTPGKRFNTENGKHFDGGFYASALPGLGNCKDLVFSNCVCNMKGQNGEFVAFDRESGKIVYRTPLKYYAWSSPVCFLNEKDEMFVVTGDCAGRMYIIDGLSGEIIWVGQIGANFESSPVVRDNHLYVGSRGRHIYGLSLK